ncbi:MAG: glycosyltransferase [Bacilli bacterium]
MKKIKVLEINNIDLLGRRFNGYDMIEDFKNDPDIEITQKVITKMSENKSVSTFFDTYLEEYVFNKFLDFETNELHVHSVFSFTSPKLLDSQEFKDCDIVHFHMFHNTKLSIYSLIEISKIKKVILTLHDPWFLTGRCVHFYDCKKYLTKCIDCKNLSTDFSLKEDNCNSLWKLKNKMFENSNLVIVAGSKWCYNLAMESPIIKNKDSIKHISLGIDTKKFKNYKIQKELKEKYNIDEKNVVIFLRAQKSFKGTEYAVEAFEMLSTKYNVTIITCSEKGWFDHLSNKYQIIDLGSIKDDSIIEVYNLCDIFLMPSVAENFGLMSVEAMSCEKPVIVFNNTGLPSVTDAPRCGYLVKNKDSRELMKALKTLVEDENERTRRGKLGRKLVLENYSQDLYLEKMKKLYMETFNKKIVKSLDKNKSINYKGKDAIKIMNKLNEFSCKFFDKKSKEYKQLQYDVEKVENYNIDYSNENVCLIIDNYCKDFYQLIKGKDSMVLSAGFKRKLKNRVKKVIAKIKK